MIPPLPGGEGRGEGGRDTFLGGIDNPDSGLQPSAFSLQPSQRGVALIITIILLGVVTFMAIAFLALSRRERGAVTTVTDTASARLAADTALASAEAQVIANALASTNPFNFGLLVSTNYINPNGFFNKDLTSYYYTNFNNVNYDHLSNSSAPLGLSDFLQNLANLYYRPRPPVFIPNPTNPSLPPDFRYYLDLNRNGRYDTNGWVTNVDNNLIGLGTTNLQVGDPEWIGILQRPDQPYGPNNPFVARYAFIALPVGNTLDLNAIHNQVFDENNNANPTTVNPPPTVDGYFRNQGIGSWEINLAAFLADLNTNLWLPTLPPDNRYYWYQYLTNVNQGIAFDDARALLAWRYANNYRSLNTVQYLYYGSAGQAAFQNNIDGYSDGPLMTTNLAGINENGHSVNLPWAGADNTNHFFTHQELFDATKVVNPHASPVLGFTDRLLAAGTNNSTYDRYTFYRLLSQLGTDSTPESGKMNLNYVNVDTNGNIVAGMETNFIPWTNALAFFTNAADRLLRAYTAQWRNSNPTNFATTFYSVPGSTNIIIASQWTTNYPPFGITNIPVWVSNRFVYSAAVNRLLQLAANIYDASNTNFFPSVFRPVFTNDGVNVFICGYQQILSVPYPLINGPLPYPSTQVPLSQAVDVAALVSQGPGIYYYNVYGVPWIIGAKKGLPGFNQFSMVNSVQFERLLQLERTSLRAPVWTNQMIMMSGNNNVGVSFWNSYSNDYAANYPAYLGSPNLSVYVAHSVNITLTNSDGGSSPQTNLYTTNYTIYTNRWPGSQWGQFGSSAGASGSGAPAANSFFVNLWTNNFIPLSVYNFSAHQFQIVTNEFNLSSYWDTNRTILDPLPQFGLLTTNWLQAVIVDNGQVIDYVQLRGPNDNANLNSVLQDQSSGGAPNYDLWVTNVWGSGTMPSWGIIDQIDISSQPVSLPGSAKWSSPPNPTITGLDPITAARDFFFSMLNGTFTFNYVNTLNGQTYTYTNNQLAVQAGYTATRTIFVPYLYQVNDPLVHYLASDLDAGAGAVWQNTSATNGVWYTDATTPIPNPPTTTIGRYQPWGQPVPITYQTADYNFGAYNLVYKDPLVWSADYWNFPTNKYPTVGWLGRVHRGTPWQTVYLKAHNVLHPASTLNNASGTNTWTAWTGDTQLTYGQYFDAVNSTPVQDRLLFDLFTTSFNDNATRGTLSVNQSAGSSDPAAGLAAWSALFSGMVALNNATYMTPYYHPPPSNSWVWIQPAGLNGLNTALGNLVTNINNMRSVFTNADGVAGTFEHKGDILSVAALTEASPFLNLAGVQLTNGISDAVYEWLPQQMMSLLRCSGSPRYVIYCYGQALKPAPNSIYTTGGPFFGMVTNYQIVSEIATRAVVRFNSMVTNVITSANDGFGNLIWYSQPVVTNNNAVIESFNILPPD
jgi:hypothetical protein